MYATTQSQSTHVERFVHYEGEWPYADRQLIEQTLLESYDDAGEQLELKPGKPWICVYHIFAGRPYFMAHWNQCPEAVIKARTADQLALEIRRMYQEAKQP